MFDEMIERIRNTTIAMLLKVRIEVQRPMVQPIEQPKPAVDTAQLSTNAAESSGPVRPDAEGEQDARPQRSLPVRLRQEVQELLREK